MRPSGGLKGRAREWGENGGGGGEVREGRLMCEGGNEVGGRQLPLECGSGLADPLRKRRVQS